MMQLQNFEKQEQNKSSRPQKIKIMAEINKIDVKKIIEREI